MSLVIKSHALVEIYIGFTAVPQLEIEVHEESAIANYANQRINHHLHVLLSEEHACTWHPYHIVIQKPVVYVLDYTN